MEIKEIKNDIIKAIHYIQPSPEEIYKLLAKGEKTTFKDAICKLHNGETVRKDSIKNLEDFIDRMLKKKTSCGENKKSKIYFLYERNIFDLKSEISYLRSLSLERNNQLKAELKFLRKELREKNSLVESLIKSHVTHIDFNTTKSIAGDLVEQSDSKHTKNRKINKLNKHAYVARSNKYIKDQVRNLKVNKKAVVWMWDDITNGIQNEAKSPLDYSSQENHPRCVSFDKLDHIKPTIRKKPNEIVVLFGISESTNEVNTLGDAMEIAKLVREETPKTKLTFTSLIIENGRQDISQKVNDMNARLKRYCKQEDIVFLENFDYLIGKNFIGKNFRRH